MTKRDELSDALKLAMKARDQATVTTVRLILAKIKDRDIEARGGGNSDGIDDAGVLSVLQGMIKQRRDSIEMYQKGNRQDLVDQEAAEIVIIERFLPQQLDASATEAAIRETIAAIGAAGIKDMGKTMAALKEKYAGQIDFQKASGIVKTVLNG
jgi:uncharacterized protein YqeY